MVGRQDGTRLWWNIGGWGNGQHAIELNQEVVGHGVPGSIEQDRWCDLKVKLSDRRLRCYLNGKLIHDETVLPPKQFFAVAGTDKTTGELIVKAIHLSAQPLTATLNLAGAAHVGTTAQITVLKSDRPSDNNSLDQPGRVLPVVSEMAISGATFAHEFPASSLTVLRVKTK